VGECSKSNKKKKAGMCQLMMLENISLTMHDDELSYKILANILRESWKKAALQAGQRTYLVDFTHTSLLGSQIKISPYVSGVVSFFSAIFAIFVLQPK